MTQVLTGNEGMGTWGACVLVGLKLMPVYNSALLLMIWNTLCLVPMHENVGVSKRVCTSGSKISLHSIFH